MAQSDLFLGAKSDSSPFVPTDIDIESPTQRTRLERGDDIMGAEGKVHDMQIWTRHLTLYAILGNLGMLITATSPQNGGVLR